MAYIPNKIIELDNPNGAWEIHSTIKLDEIHYLIDWKIVYNIIDQRIVYTFDIVHSSIDPSIMNNPLKILYDYKNKDKIKLYKNYPNMIMYDIETKTLIHIETLWSSGNAVYNCGRQVSHPSKVSINIKRFSLESSSIINTLQFEHSASNQVITEMYYQNLNYNNWIIISSPNQNIIDNFNTIIDFRTLKIIRELKDIVLYIPKYDQMILYNFLNVDKPPPGKIIFYDYKLDRHIKTLSGFIMFKNIRELPPLTDPFVIIRTDTKFFIYNFILDTSVNKKLDTSVNKKLDTSVNKKHIYLDIFIALILLITSRWICGYEYNSNLLLI
jgi:hypothetical protein